MQGLYVHFPFCASKCFYCDFYSEAGRLHLVDKYIDALLQEAERYKGTYFDTMYIGGGTPGLLAAAGITRLMRGLSSHFDLSGLQEATVEVNPDSADMDLMFAAIASGLNRISIGVQSLNDNELIKAGRIHTALQTMKAIRTAADCGFADISCDVIVGLPGQTPRSLADTLSTLVHQGVVHISAYCLSIEEGTAFAHHPPADLPDEERQAELFEFTAHYLKECGFVHYEISNFALPGRECRHNLNYWRGGEYLGLGPSAASHLHGRRFKNTANLDKYIEEPLRSECDVEMLDAEAKSAEEAMLRLRLLEEGLDVANLTARYGEGNTACLRKRLKKLANDGMLAMTGDRYRLPAERVMTSNSVFVDIIN